MNVHFHHTGGDMRAKVLVTAGGTKVRIDDVRYLGNFSKGNFGLALAKAFADRGADVHLLGSEELIEREALAEDSQTLSAVTPFRYFEDFRDSLYGIVEREKPDVIVMAAAVSDWLSAAPRSGKIDSRGDDLTLRFIPAPKLIAELRERCGIHAFIVGFKLLSGAPRAELLAKAKRQMRECRLNLVVANDLSEIRDGRHPVTLVTPEGGAIPVGGARSETAAAIASFVERRRAVRWTKTNKGGDHWPLPSNHPAIAEVEKLLRFSKEAELYEGTDGNLSWRAAPGDGFLVSPRQMDKAAMLAGDFAYVTEDPAARELTCFGQRKSSIDSSVQAALYRALPNVGGFLHLHPSAGIILPDVGTTFPYPCGALEEADEVLAALGPSPAGAPFAVELKHHGYLLGLEAGAPDRLLGEWLKATDAYRLHLADIGETALAAALKLQPIFASTRIVGVFATHRGEGWSSCFLLPEHRKGGLGERLMAELDRRGIKIKAHDLCGVLPYYVSHGWAAPAKEGNTAILVPPSKRTDVRPAATVCLVELATRRVLLGRRKTRHWNGLWAFPGGALQTSDGGDHLFAAWREAWEETAILRPATWTPAFEVETTVGAGERGETAFAMRTFVYFVDRLPSFRPSPEMDPEAHDLDAALRDLPMGRGTKQVLRAVVKALDGRA